MIEEKVTDLEQFLKVHLPEVEVVELIRQSLTHRSYAFEHNIHFDNERLEFLGDSLIGFVVSDAIYQKFPEATEGELSKMKAKLVSRTALGRIAHEMGLGTLVLLGKGEEKSGGRHRLSLVGSALEAFVGAIYLEAGLDVAVRFIRDSILKNIDQLFEDEDIADYKSRFQEMVQKRFQQIPVYKMIEESGPDHDKRFCVEVRVMDKILGTGWGSRKKTAENSAAKEALGNLDSLN